MGDLIKGPWFDQWEDIVERRIAWLWEGWIPRGAIIVVAGDPGIGKTTAVYDLVARLSRGDPMPDGEATVPTTSLILPLEEMTREIIAPRLRLMKAAPGRIPYIAKEKMPSFPRDIGKLEEAIVMSGASLVVIDPLFKAIGSSIDLNNNQAASQVMMKFADIAERTQCTIMFIHHLNKSTGAKGIYRSAGAISIVGSARASIAVAKVPGTNHVAWIKYKTNFGFPKKPLIFETFSFPEPDHHLGGVRWLGHSDVDLDEILSDLNVVAKMQRSKPPDMGEVDLWLQDYMERAGEAPCAPEDVLALGKELGYGKEEIINAKVKLGIRTVKLHGPVPRVVWTKAAKGGLQSIKGGMDQ